MKRNKANWLKAISELYNDKKDKTLVIKLLHIMSTSDNYLSKEDIRILDSLFPYLEKIDIEEVEVLKKMQSDLASINDYSCEMKLSDYLETLRIRWDISKQALADYLGIPINTYVKYEEGSRCPDNFKKKAIVDKLQVFDDEGWNIVII